MTIQGLIDALNQSQKKDNGVKTDEVEIAVGADVYEISDVVLHTGLVEDDERLVLIVTEARPNV